MRPLPLWAAAAACAVARGGHRNYMLTDLKCTCVIDNNTKCVINTTAQGNTLAWNGSVLITGGAQLSTGTGGDLVISANSSLEIEDNSTLTAAYGKVKLSGARLSIRSGVNISARDAVELEAVTGGVEVSSSQGDDMQPMLSAALISAVANGSDSTTIAAVLTSYPPDKPKPGSFPELQLHTSGTLTLGPLKRDTMWNLKALRATADTIVLLNHSIRTDGISCSNSALNMTPVDVCAQSLGGDLPADIVAFDFKLVAAKSLTVESTAVHAASMLLCSGGQAELKDQTKLDADGRGCAANGGSGPGARGGVKCGGAGGSHLGAGGSGARSVASQQMQECADGGKPYDGPAGDPAGGPHSWWSSLPTQGASGGGCAGGPGVADYSAGGGLVWVSAQDLSVSTSAQLVADGVHGDFGAKGTGAEGACGGGAGGQVLVYASSLRATDAAPSPDASEPQLVHLSAAGGDTACSKDALTFGGGGGGGVVAFGSQNSSAPWVSDATKFQISVGGGSMSSYCQQFVPKSYWHSLAGQPGKALPLASCDAGFATMFCTPCPVGTYSPGGLVSDCLECTNKKGLSNYTNSKWPNSSCNYVCNPDVPFVAVNSECLNTAGFFFHFFGGTWGLLSMLLCLVVLSGLLLWRSRRAKRRHDAQERALPNTSESLSPTGSFVQVTRTTNSPPTLAARLSARRQSCQRRLRLCIGVHVRDEGDLHFTTEHLPFHTCRIYLAGSNRSSDPWTVPTELPEQLAGEVSEHGWQRLAREAKPLAAVPRRDRLAQRCLDLLYPALSMLHGRWRRGHRAVQLARLARGLSEGSNFWRPLHATFDAQGQLMMCFGQDPAATLGFLDFFNFSRSPLDWAPVDLRRQARLLPVCGLGSQAEPLAVDTADPLIEDLMQTDLGRAPVCDMIVAFNNASRLVSQGELLQSSPSEMVVELHRSLKRCAENRGLQGLAHVLRVVRGDSAAASWQASPVRPPGAPVQAPDDVTAAPSFTDLVSRQRARPIGLSESLVHAEAAAARPRVGLCLMFAKVGSPEGASLGSTTAAGGPLPPELARSMATLRLDPQRALSSPEACAELAWRLQPQSGPAEGETPRRARPCSSRLLAWAVSFQQSATADVALVALVALLLADLLASVLLAFSLFNINPGMVLLWLLLPPLAQPLALASGLALLASNEPWAGRLFAAFNTCSVVSHVVANLGLLISLRLQSWLFVCAQLAGVCAVKFALFVVAAVHTANLEAGRDVAMLSRGTAGRVVSPTFETDVAALPHVDSEESLDGGGDAGRGADRLPALAPPGRLASEAALFYGGVDPSLDRVRSWSPQVPSRNASMGAGSVPGGVQSPF